MSEARPGPTRFTGSAMIVKRIRISSAHHIPNHPGKCKQPHGHNYLIEAGYEGPIQGSTGMVKDFYEVKYDLQQVIDGPCDHQDLNLVYPGMLTTAENLAARWLTELHELDPRAAFIRVWETDDSYVETDVYSLGLVTDDEDDDGDETR